jgi:CheY-like chemotaxis protein
MLIKSILLIESEASLREILSACLCDLGGWRVIVSNSIQQGIDLCIVSTPDAILLDASTSESDALLFIEQLKARSVSQSIPILLIAQRSNWFTLDQLQAMGFAGAITKPFTPSTLPTQITQLLGWTNEG